MVRVHQDPIFFLAHPEQSRNQIPFNAPYNLPAKTPGGAKMVQQKSCHHTNQNIKKVGLWQQFIKENSKTARGSHTTYPDADARLNKEYWDDRFQELRDFAERFL